MKTSVVLGVAGFVGGAVLLGQIASGDALGRAPSRGTVITPAATESQPLPSSAGGSIGPDVYVWGISGIAQWADGDYRAYSFGTTSCNQGDTPLAWIANTNQHPVIGQNLFRLAPDAKGHPRFEQLGQSWLKHGFCALDQTFCGSCQGTGCSSLGVGCSDPYTAARNGSQGPAGPKYQVNASTGFFPYPPANPPYSGSTARRLRVLSDEIDPTLNPGITLWAEAQYIHPQDSPEDDLGNAVNNISYRQMTINQFFYATLVGETQQQVPAINQWALSDPEVLLSNVDLPGEGRFIVASRAYDNGDGTWDYEYAVFNMNVDRSAGSFAVNIVDGAAVTDEGFRDVDYHSGEPFDGTDWAVTNLGSKIAWETEDYATNQDANAIRWATMYNFRFTANAAPAEGTAELGMFKPGATMMVTVPVHAPDTIVEPVCNEDLDGSGSVDFGDVLAILSAWGPCAGCPEDLDASSEVDFNDLLLVLSAWGDC